MSEVVAGSSIPAMVARAADNFGELLAIRDDTTSMTYAQLAGAADSFGAALVESGIEPGDRVGIWCFNCADWVVAVLGTFAPAGVLVPLNTRFKGPEAAELLARSRAKVLVTVTDFLDTDYIALLEGAGTPLPDLDTTVVVR